MKRKIVQVVMDQVGPSQVERLREKLGGNVKNDRGQALVEMALTLPMLLVVMLMVTEFGRALYQYNMLCEATRSGARVAITSVSTAMAKVEGEKRMAEFLYDTGIAPANPALQVLCTVDMDYNRTGQHVVTTTARMPFRWVLQGPLPTNAGGEAAVSPQALTIQARTIMRAETF